MRPVIELLTDDGRTEAVGGGLEGSHIVDGEESVVVFSEADLAARQFALHEGVAVEVIGGVERKKRCHTYDNRPQHLVPDVEVEMGETARLVRQDAMVRVLCRELRHADAKRPALFHAPEDEVDAERVFLFHAPQRRQDVIFLADAFFRPLHRDRVVAGKGLHPGFVFLRSLAENLLADNRDSQNLAKEVDHLLRPRQVAQVAVNDDTVETVVYKNEKIAEQPGEYVHGNISHRKEKQRWAAKPSGAGQGKSISAERISFWLTRSTTSEAEPPDTMAVL